MYCLINKIIEKRTKKGWSIEAIRSYIGQRYGINIDSESIRQRLQALKMKYEWKV